MLRSRSRNSRSEAAEDLVAALAEVGLREPAGHHAADKSRRSSTTTACPAREAATAADIPAGVAPNTTMFAATTSSIARHRRPQPRSAREPPRAGDAHQDQAQRIRFAH